MQLQSLFPSTALNYYKTPSNTLLSSLLLLLLTANLFPNLAEARVTKVNTIETFYNNARNERNYTFVKYFTNWCSHCKRLEPIYKDLSDNYKVSTGNITLFDIPLNLEEIGETSIDNKININFLEVDCEQFGRFEICSRLEGFPYLEVIKPLKKEEQTLPQEEEKPLGFWKKLLSVFFILDDNLLNFVDRTVEFDGNRDLQSLTKFLDNIILHDYNLNLIDRIIASECEPNGDAICHRAAEYHRNISDLDTEEIMLENSLLVTKDSNDLAALPELKFKLLLIQAMKKKKEQQQQQQQNAKSMEYDEL
ncbi:uncharacterized protein SCODWIG_01037 [Saccharomycodes ludwigii]|uniref:Thioredoxin domain-containing protein n=1 Tax=Saccharomycodes ludwigii TaxID=36035 RepID=A0A376B3L4_9ASCO|nr:hypothetical protein SCDLUD_005114 [Saccharomycodes ludwigii]KAH3898779.1 hypothetical protein SCDLUD_005114 [Saccharomycodes ludwigii]SSD59276.1 uncharacterized protein SCODWIG_01037 [Saccharomycodes ludwigii]